MVTRRGLTSDVQDSFQDEYYTQVQDVSSGADVGGTGTGLLLLVFPPQLGCRPEEVWRLLAPLLLPGYGGFLGVS